MTPVDSGPMTTAVGTWAPGEMSQYIPAPKATNRITAPRAAIAPQPIATFSQSGVPADRFAASGACIGAESTADGLGPALARRLEQDDAGRHRYVQALHAARHRHRHAAGARV